MPRNTPRLVVRPFLGTCVDDYLRRYWCVSFTHTRAAKENAKLKRYANWYATNMKTVYTDKIASGSSIGEQMERELKERFGVSVLPVLFVNKRCVGPLSVIERLDEERRLKDILQFGLKWNTSSEPVGDRADPHTGAPVPLRPLPARYGDAQFFRAKYVGGPPRAVPAGKLPQFSPTRLE